MVKLKIVYQSSAWLSRQNELESFLRDAFLLSDQDPDFILNLNDQMLLTSREGLSLSINFDEDKINYGKKINRKEILFRALGIEKSVVNVVDLTCGLARDAAMMSQIGFQVHAIERNPLLWLLVTEAQKKSQSPWAQRIKFLFGDSAQCIEQVLGDRTSDFFAKTAVYFDPMFPQKKKSALPSKEMQIFKQIVGPDEDADRVLEKYLGFPWARVVVKRPLQADFVLRKPKFSMEGKLVRYDVY